MPDDGLPDIAAIPITYDRDTGAWEYDTGDLDDFAAVQLLDETARDLRRRLPAPRRSDDAPDPEDRDGDDLP